MIILPIPPLLKTQLPRKDKIGVSIMFILGLLITGASCFRMQYINVAYSPNPFWDFEPALLWSLVELAMSFLVTSLPAIHSYHTQIVRPKVRAYLQSRREAKSSQNSGSGPSGQMQSNGRSRLRTVLAGRGQRRANNNLISTLLFTPISWKSSADRESHQTREGFPTPQDESVFGSKAPQISLKDLGGTPGLRSLSDVVNRRDSIQEERGTAHGLAWASRSAPQNTGSKGGGDDTISPSKSTQTPKSWLVGDNIV